MFKISSLNNNLCLYEGIDISYTMEISPNWCEKGHSGFKEHEGSILHIGLQVYAAAKALADEI